MGMHAIRSHCLLESLCTPKNTQPPHATRSLFVDSLERQSQPTLTVVIGGLSIEIPYQDYIVNERTCVLKMKNSPTAFLLGDIFFKRAVVIHDMRDMQHPTVQIGKRNPQYFVTDKLIHIGGAGDSPAVKVPISKIAAPHHALEQMRRKAGRIFSQLPSVMDMLQAGDAAQSFDRTPLTSSNSFIYYAQISAGSPPQSDIHVIVDTGSSVFAIFSVDHGGMSTLQASCYLLLHIAISHNLPAAHPFGLRHNSWRCRRRFVHLLVL
jgi:hypothetical protein